jgi:hypothetical protein
MKAKSMKKKNAQIDDDDPLDHEIDFSNAIPNPFARDFGRMRNIRILAPDLLEFFPDSHSMNEALRAIAQVARRLETLDGNQLKVSAKTVSAPKPSKKKARS